MPRGRKRKNVFVPMPWIPNSSSEDEHQGLQVPDDVHLAQVPRLQGNALDQEVQPGNDFCII